jgi:uncharacterized membrane protein
VTPEVQARIEALERRVEELEKRIGGASAAAPRTIAAVPPAAAPRRALETRVGVNWISRIAVLTVVLALAFFFEYAFENRWITERGRVGLGLGLAALLLAVAERFHKAGQRAYGQSLAAAGIAFLYLSFWAAFELYHLVPEGAAYTLMALVTAGAGVQALRYGSHAVALLGLAGGFATPMLLPHAGDAGFILGYALLLDAGAVWLARARGWWGPEPLAVVGTAALYLAAGPPQRFFTWFVAAYFGVFAAGAGTGAFQAAQVLASVAVALLWAPGVAGPAGALAFAAAGLAVADRRGRPALAAGSFAGFWLAYAAWRESSGAPAPGSVLAVATLGFLLYVAWAARRAPLRMADLFVTALNAGFFFGAGYELLRTSYAAFAGLLAVTVAAVEMALARRLQGHDDRGSVLAAGVGWVLLVLAAPVQFAGYRITMAWALEGAAAAWIGSRMRERRAVIAAVAVFALALGRLALVDSRMYGNAAEYAAVVNARFLAFAVSAAALAAAAWWTRGARLAPWLYAAGHATMLWGLTLEAIGWAARTAAPADFRSVAGTAVSVVAAAYAVLLVAAGAAWKHTGSRLLGVGLVGLVVLKLYLYDVWLLAAFYRMTAFAILGVLLLVVSYVYSRRARA